MVHSFTLNSCVLVWYAGFMVQESPSSCGRLSTCYLCFCLQAFGEDIAILAGDALLSLSFEYIARETRHVAPERVLRVSFLSLMPIAVMHRYVYGSCVWYIHYSMRVCDSCLCAFDIRVMFKSL